MSLTEAESRHQDLEKQSTLDLLKAINQEDRSVPEVVAGCIPAIEQLVEQTVVRVKEGGRIFYLGAGTSGRLGVVDASEIPPTYGASDELFIGLIAGGDAAIRKAQEFAEDDAEGGWRDMQPFKPIAQDVVVGIAASGRTPYVVGALENAQEKGLLTASICCNPDSLMAQIADIPIVAAVGPEFVTGSTRMKAGTAQKLILNMFSTSVMIRLGHVKGNRMVDMQLSNHKLVDRGTKMIMAHSSLGYEQAKQALLMHGSVRKALQHLPNL